MPLKPGPAIGLIFYRYWVSALTERPDSFFRCFSRILAEDNGPQFNDAYGNEKCAPPLARRAPNSV